MRPSTVCRIVAFALLTSWVPALRAEGPAASKKVAAALQPFVDRHELAGAVALVADKDRVLSVNAVGFADVAAGKPMTPDTLFWIASQSKSITAAAFMMLVVEGRVQLDDPVEKYLPEFKGQQVADKAKGATNLVAAVHPITVREILSHTSGLPFSTDAEKPTLDTLSLKDAVASYARTPLLFQPGTKYQYSNAGINTAGRLIEVLSGTAYEDFLQKRLLDPLGMKDTTFWPSEEQLRRLAKAYKPNKENTGLEETTIGQLKYPLSDRNRKPMPAGGLFSTAADVARFCQMLLNGGTRGNVRFLTEAAVNQLTSKQTGDEVKEQYGLGFSTGGGTFGHGGALSTNMTVDPKSGLITVFLVQHAGFPGNGGQSHNEFRQAALKQFGKEAK